MNDLPNRVQCWKCGANNFPSSEMCWKCGQRLREQPEQPQPAQYAPPPPLYDPSHVEPGAPYPMYRSGRSADNLITLGYVLGGISYPAMLCCCCGCISPIFSLAGIILGAVSESQGDKRGRWVILVGAISLLLFGGGSVLTGLGSHWSSTSFPGGPPGGFPRGFPRGFPMPGP